MILLGRKKPSYFIISQFVDGTKFKLGVRDRTPMWYNVTVVFLHSDSYDSRIWEDLQTLDILHALGYRALAIDLPGYGYSQSDDIPNEDFNKAVILEHALIELNATEAVLVVPSMSGSYALPLLVRGFLKLKGFVAIAPHSVENFSKVEYSSVKIPTLIIYGDHDTNYGAQSAVYLRKIPSSKLHVMRYASHACYVHNPDEFHTSLVSFLRSIIN